MKTLFVPGYGNRREYIEAAIRHWPDHYGLDPEVHVFGWSNADAYEARWQAFEAVMQKYSRLALVGISAGAGVVLRALAAYPEKVASAVSICGPARLEGLNPFMVERRYGMIRQSLGALALEAVDAERVMTVRPIYDEVVPASTVVVPGADNRRVNSLFHIPSIIWATRRYGGQIAEFITQSALPQTTR